MIKSDIYNIMSYCCENYFHRLLHEEEFTCIYYLVIVDESKSGAVNIDQSCKLLVSGTISDSYSSPTGYILTGKLT